MAAVGRGSRSSAPNVGGAGVAYIIASDVHLVHPICDRKQELDSKLLVGHVDVGHDLTA